MISSTVGVAELNAIANASSESMVIGRERPLMVRNHLAATDGVKGLGTGDGA